MGRFLNVLKKPSATNQESVPSLPHEVSYKELIHMTKRGFLAKKVAEYLEMDQSEADKIYFTSLSKRVLGLPSDEQPDGQFNYVAEQLLQWIDGRENILEKVDQLAINSQMKNAILKACEIHKRDLMETLQEKGPDPDQKLNDKWVIYRDVIYSATQGKFSLITEGELVSYQKGKILVEQEIKMMTDIPKCRQLAKEQLEQRDYHKTDLMSWLLVISEAITNTLKHATEGKMTLLEDLEKGELRVIVADKGPGFELENLPKAALMAGYSTKKSLGQGFNLMLKMTERMLLYTCDQGSNLILIFRVNQQGETLNETGS